MQIIRIKTSQNVEIDYEVAGLGERVLARLVDWGAFIALYYIFYFIILLFFLPTLTRLDSSSGFPVFLIVLLVIYGLVYIFYDLVTEIFFNGQSLGKYAIKIKVVSLDGARPTIGQYLLRWVFRLIDFVITFGIGALISVAVSEKKQRIGDLVAGTTLVKTKPATTLADLYFTSPTEEYEPVFPQVSTLNDDDITLVHEVIANFKQIGNNSVVYNMALKVKEHLGVQNPAGMNDFQLLETVAKDYAYVTSRMSV